MSPIPVASPDPAVEAYLRLSTCNISDALDRLHLQGAPAGILPLWPGCRKIAAFTSAQRGLGGVVIDGVTRDVDEMKSLGFSAYGRGIIQQSIRARSAFGG